MSKGLRVINARIEKSRGGEEVGICVRIGMLGDQNRAWLVISGCRQGRVNTVEGGDNGNGKDGNEM